MENRGRRALWRCAVRELFLLVGRLRGIQCKKCSERRTRGKEGPIVKEMRIAEKMRSIKGKEVKRR
jgi:hypothetical protein